MVWKVLCAVLLAAYGTALLRNGWLSTVTMLRWSGFIVGGLCVVVAVWLLCVVVFG